MKILLRNGANINEKNVRFYLKQKQMIERERERARKGRHLGWENLTFGNSYISLLYSICESINSSLKNNVLILDSLYLFLSLFFSLPPSPTLLSIYSFILSILFFIFFSSLIHPSRALYENSFAISLFDKSPQRE